MSERIYTPATPAELIDRIDDSIATYASAQDYDSTVQILADILAGSQLYAKNAKIDWSIVERRARATLRSAKAEARVKPTKPVLPPADLYRIYILAPSGETIIDQVATPYSFAVLQNRDGVWAVRSRVNSKMVGQSRCHTFRKAGTPKDALVVVATSSTEPVLLPDATHPAPVIEIAKPAKAARKSPKPAPVEAQTEAEAPQVEVEASQNLIYPGSEKVHAPNGQYSGALCGAGKGKDPRQIDAAVTCKNCERVKIMLELTAEEAAKRQQDAAAEAPQVEAE